MSAKHPGSWTCTICGEVTRYGEWPKCKHGPVPEPLPDIPHSMRGERIAFLERKREAVKTDLQLKFEDSDWHGVADAAMDLRDVDCELAGLRY